MTPSELRAAAERLRRIKACVETSQVIYGVPVPKNPTRMESIEAGNKVKRLMRNDEELLIEHAMSTVRADDDEAVTVDRLSKIGWKLIDDEWTSPHGGNGVRIWWHEPHGPEGWSVVNGGNQTWITSPKNMGQVRDLCRALGVPLEVDRNEVQ